MLFAKKSLGQNFLRDKNIIKKIVELIKIENRNIIEIGPGTGSLTDEILKKKPKSLQLMFLKIFLNIYSFLFLGFEINYGFYDYGNYENYRHCLPN